MQPAYKIDTDIFKPTLSIVTPTANKRITVKNVFVKCFTLLCLHSPDVY